MVATTTPATPVTIASHARHGATSAVASPPGTGMCVITSEIAIAAPRASEKNTTSPA